MDKDYLKAILGDIEKVNSPEEKISLLVIGFSELAENSYRHDQILLNTTKSLESLEIITREFRNGIQMLQDHQNEAVDAITLNGTNITQSAEKLAECFESINKVNQNLIDMQLLMNKIIKRLP